MDNEKLAKTLIVGMKNEIRVIELYSQSVKLEISDESRSNIKDITADERKHLDMLNSIFEKKLGKHIDRDKLNDDSLKAISKLSNDSSPLHILDLAKGYEERELVHYKNAFEEYGDDKELSGLFSHLVKDEEAHLEVLEKERKALLGHPFDEFELDLYVRE
ncbi:MAG: hypothetical protein D6734_01375 [Candidatus Schekmanbacteria bacterium]|nr:MAG: hypothetical protein D6734_01375 [Candidatus Schekmanbacteria bacterium]